MMNDLSIMLYLADVAPTMSLAIQWVIFLPLLILFVIYLLGVIEVFGDAKYDETGEASNDEGKLAVAFRKQGWTVIILTSLWAGLFLVPGDEETYYAIAASEAGEDLLATPEMGKAREALNKWLDEQLASEEE